MLKGDTKGIVGENIRTMKAKGMSERDAVMASMKSSPKNAKKSSEVSPPSPMNEDYPYGLRLELDHDTLKKLGHDSLPQVGTKMALHAKARVKSASENSSEGEDSPRRSVSLQITHMKTDCDMDAEDDAEDTAGEE
jgi:hypothetical protein